MIRVCSAGEARGDLVLDEIGFAHPAFAALLEIGPLVDSREKAIGFIDERRGQRHARGVARDGEKPFLGPRVVEPLDRGAQTVLRNADPDLARGDLLDGVGFVENDEVVREKIAFLALFLFLRAAQEHEKERVIKHDDVGCEQASSRLLEETARILPARFRRADVRFAANLRPDFRVRLDRQIAQRAVARRPRPIGQPRQSSARSC